MKRARWISALLTAAMVTGMLTACGGSTGSSQSTSAAESTTAAETTEAASSAESSAQEAASEEQTEYAYLDDSTGFCIRNWTGTYAQLNESEDAYVVPQSGDTVVKSVEIGMLYVVCMDLPEDFDENAEDAYQEKQKYYSVLVLAPVVFTADKDMTEESMKALLDADDSGAFPEGYSLKAFKTTDGYTLFEVSGMGEGAEYSEYASDETRETFAKLQEEWETQRAQFEIASYQASEGVTFSAMDYNGNKVDESIFKDAKLTMVNIWGLSCSPCIGEMPDLQKLNDNIDDFQVVTILSDVRSMKDTDCIEEAHDIMETQGAGSLRVILGSDELDAVFRYTGTPTSYLVDSNGNILGRPHVGAAMDGGNYDILEQWVQEGMDQLK